MSEMLNRHSIPCEPYQLKEDWGKTPQDERERSNADELPAGGTDLSCFNWQEVWYPIHYVRDLNKSQLTSFTLLGRDLVIWWEETAKTWRVFEDQCPHRLAPLSEGRITEDSLLECPYHGWSFSGTGRCERIPQQLAGSMAAVSQRACATSLPTIERQGLLFVYPGKPENAEKVKIPIVEPLEESSDAWVCIDTFRDLPYDALTLLENVLDTSHVPYTHHRSVGNRSNAGPVELAVLESGRQGFQGMWEEGPRRGTLGRQDTIFIAPGLMWHDLTSKQFGRTLTVVYATPIRKGECRLFARFPFQFASKLPAFLIQLTPRWYSHFGQNAVLEDDQIFLHKQERYLEQKGGSGNFTRAFYLPTGADRFVSELRQWVNLHNADPFPAAILPPALPKEALLDRYDSHTVKCTSCRAALTRIQRLRMGIAVIEAIAWASTLLLPLFFSKNPVLAEVSLAAIILAFGVAWLGLGKLERRFYQGRDVPPRNLPEKG